MSLNFCLRNHLRLLVSSFIQATNTPRAFFIFCRRQGFGSFCRNTSEHRPALTSPRHIANAPRTLPHRPATGNGAGANARADAQGEPDDRSERIPLLALHGFTGCGADFQWLAAQTADLFDWHTFDFPGHGTRRNLCAASACTAAATARELDAALAALSATGSTSEATTTANDKTRPHPVDFPSDYAAAISTAVPAANTAARTANAAVPAANTPPQTQTPSKPTLPVLLGYSMGGRMALRYLARYGVGKISGLILIGASAGLANAAERRTRRHADHTLAARIEAGGIDAFIQHWNSLPLIASQRQSPHFTQLQQMRRANSPHSLAASLRGIGTGAVAPVHSRLPQITVPCLLITGAQDSKFTAAATQMTAALPHAQHVTINQAGHAPHWENPQATESAIRLWTHRS